MPGHAVAPEPPDRKADAAAPPQAQTRRVRAAPWQGARAPALGAPPGDDGSARSDALGGLLARAVLQRAAGTKHSLVGAVLGARAPLAFAHTTEAFVKVVPAAAGAPPPAAPVVWGGSRPKTAQAEVRPKAIPDRDATAVALAYTQQVAGGIAQNNKLLGFDGGHVIGLHLGGPNIPQNVVPMLPAFNRGVWKNMEDATKALDVPDGSYLKMTVSMDYEDPAAPDWPTKFTVDRKFVDIATNVETDGVAPNPKVLRQPTDIEVTAALTDPVHIAAVTTPLNTLAAVTVEPAATLFHLPAGQTVLGYVNANHHLPPPAKSSHPITPGPVSRPYENLDILWMNGGLATGAISTGRDFGEDQRKLILQTNLARNGTLKSDDHADPHQNLDERGAANHPEIDHIIPKSLGGSNLFSNARVISWQLNNKEARVKPLAGLVDWTRLAYPSLPRAIPKQAELLVDQYIARRYTIGQPGVDPIPAPITVAAIASWGPQTFNATPSARLNAEIQRQLDQLKADGSLTGPVFGVYGVAP